MVPYPMIQMDSATEVFCWVSQMTRKETISETTGEICISYNQLVHWVHMNLVILCHAPGSIIN